MGGPLQRRGTLEVKTGNPTKAAIEKMLIADWTAISPGYSYSGKIKTYELVKPGQYLIGGADCSTDYSPEEADHPPYQVFSGKIETNTIGSKSQTAVDGHGAMPNRPMRAALTRPLTRTARPGPNPQ
jgi:hypothetical protein